MGHGNADGPRHRAHREQPAELADPAPGLIMHEHPAGPAEHGQQCGYRAQAEEAVVALLLQLRYLFGLVRVGRVAADDKVQQRDHPEDDADHQPGPGIGLLAAQRPVIAQGDAQYRDQPQPVADAFQGEHPVGG